MGTSVIQIIKVKQKLNSRSSTEAKLIGVEEFNRIICWGTRTPSNKKYFIPGLYEFDFIESEWRKEHR